MKACLLAIAIALVLGIAATFADTPAPPATHVDALVIEHTPDGVRERTGIVSQLQITGPAVLLEFTDDGDALFHNGFDGGGAPLDRDPPATVGAAP